jgi:DNA polymerase III delta subunit
MLYVFCGSTPREVRERAFLRIHEEEERGARVVRIDSAGYAPGLFADLAGSLSLFGGSELYLIDTPSQLRDMYEDTIEHLPVFAESRHTFVIIEETVLTAEKKKFEKYATQLVEVKQTNSARFDAFAFAEALAAKDKKRLWLVLQDARAAGIPTEESIGILWWQLKALRLAARTRSAAEAGMKDFPYQKAKRALSQFTDGEVVTLAQSLLMLRHHGHRGNRDLDLALEEWVLSM